MYPPASEKHETWTAEGFWRRFHPTAALPLAPPTARAERGLASVLAELVRVAGLEQELLQELGQTRQSRPKKRVEVPTSDWLTTAESAVVARQSTSNIQKAIQKGKLKASNIGNAARPVLRVHRDDLDHWIRGKDSKMHRAAEPPPPSVQAAPNRVPRGTQHAAASTPTTDETNSVAAILARLTIKRRPKS